jgi:hypothetical protein
MPKVIIVDNTKAKRDAAQKTGFVEHFFCSMLVMLFSAFEDKVSIRKANLAAEDC